MRPTVFLFVISMTLAGASATRAFATEQKASPAQSPLVAAVTGCVELPSAEERHACYDRTVPPLAKAVADRNVYVVEKEAVKKTRRSLFGLPLPDLGIFGGDEAEPGDANTVESIESEVVSAQQGGYGNWVISLSDGSVWEQTDGQMIAPSPRKGRQVTVVRASMGSYKMRIGNQSGVRVRRLR